MSDFYQTTANVLLHMRAIGWVSGPVFWATCMTTAQLPVLGTCVSLREPATSNLFNANPDGGSEV